MSKTCKECGRQVDDNAQACPNCGNPMEEESVSAYMDEDVLAQGISTDAELTISSYANVILKFGYIVAVIASIISLISVVINFYFTYHFYGNTARSFFHLLLFVIPVIIYFLIKWVAKLMWATIMIFVNISTTLKRIEIKMEKYGTK